MEPPILPYLSEGSNRLISTPVIKGLERPVVNVVDPSLSYPVLDVPTQEEFNAAVNAEHKKKEEEKEEKSRGLPDSKSAIPQVQVPQIPVQNTQDNRNISNQPPTSTQIGSPEMHVPILGTVPIPTNKEVALAGTTAVAATAAAILGKSAVEFLLKFFKPIANQLFVRGKKLLNKDLTDYELQIFFAFEKDAQMKKVSKLLKKEQKKEKVRQYKEAQSKKS
jgi:hypothetical protein